MNITAFLIRIFHPPILRLAIVAQIALLCCTPAFCGEIHDAAEAGNLAKVTALLKDHPELVSSENNANWGYTPLHMAAENGNKDMAELLMKNRADINARDRKGWTALHVAARNGRKDVAELLLANNAAVNARDNLATPFGMIGGNTPLHFAALNGHKAIAELLLSHKADINAKDNDGKTPMKLAAEKGKTDMVELLRQHGGHE
jgi:uncharacterized protein